MSDLGNPKPSGTPNEKPPKCNWEATRKERFFDLKFSHYIELILTAALACFAWLQFTVYKQQAGIMEADHRPRVSIDIAVGEIAWKPDGVHVVRSYELKNSGHSTATNVFVQDAVAPFIGPGDSGNFRGQSKKILEAVKKNPGVGFPLFPEQTRHVSSTDPFAQKDILDYQEWVRTLRPPGEPDSPAPSAIDVIPLIVVYAVDYGAEVGQPHHQTFCWAYIGPRDPSSPYGGTLPTPINRAVPAAEVAVLYGGIDCGAN